MTAIETVGLTKSFNGRRAVDSLTLAVEKGELFALLGPNGAGKTTTIRMLSCVLRPTSGDARLLGESILSNPQAVKQRINVSPQETAVASNLTVKENLEFIARVYGSSRQKAAAEAHAMLDLFGLSERSHERAKTLSGGMQRRLSIAMGLITAPEILFLDEPTLGLDVRARRELWHAISALKGRVTIILTTHYLEEAEALSDRIAIMYGGRLRAVGTAEELKHEAGAPTLEDAFLKLTEGEELP